MNARFETGRPGFVLERSPPLERPDAPLWPQLRRNLWLALALTGAFAAFALAVYWFPELAPDQLDWVTLREEWWVFGTSGVAPVVLSGLLDVGWQALRSRIPRRRWEWVLAEFAGDEVVLYADTGGKQHVACGDWRYALADGGRIGGRAEVVLVAPDDSRHVIYIATPQAEVERLIAFLNRHLRGR